MATASERPKIHNLGIGMKPQKACFYKDKKSESWSSLVSCLPCEMHLGDLVYVSAHQQMREQHHCINNKVYCVFLSNEQKFSKILLQTQNVLCVVMFKSTKHDLVNIKTESWVAAEVTNSFLWTWISWAKLRCLHNLFCSNNIPHAYFSLKRNSKLSGILGSRPE